MAKCLRAFKDLSTKGDSRLRLIFANIIKQNPSLRITRFKKIKKYKKEIKKIKIEKILET